MDPRLALSLSPRLLTERRTAMQSVTALREIIAATATASTAAGISKYTATSFEKSLECDSDLFKESSSVGAPTRRNNQTQLMKNSLSIAKLQTLYVGNEK